MRRRRSDRGMRLAAAAALMAGSALACGRPRGPFPEIPELPAPPPLAAAARAPLAAPFRVTLEDAHAVVGIGVAFDLPRVEATLAAPPTPGPPAPGEPALHLRSLRLVRPDVTFPIDTIITGLNFFVTILEPRVRVDTLIVEDGRVGTLAAPSQYAGRWLWRVRDLDLRARDVLLGGRAAGAVEGFHVTRAAGRGEIKGRPFRVEQLALDVERTATAFTAAADMDLGFSLLRAELAANRANDWRVRFAGDTLAFAELRAFLPILPRVGTGAAVVALRGRGGRQVGIDAVLVDRLDIAAGESHLAAHGRIFTGGPTPRVEDVLVEASPLRAADAARMFDVAIPGGGTWVGWASADGTFREGVRLRGALAHEQDTGPVSRIALDGRIRLEPALFVDLAVTGRPIRAADTAFDVALRLRGPAEAVIIRGDARVRGAPHAMAELRAVLRDLPDAPPVVTGEARIRAEPAVFGPVADGAVAGGAADGGAAGGAPVAGAPPEGAPAPRAPPPPLRATARGNAVLAEGGPIDVRITADSLPLALIPVPEAVDSVRGTVDAVARVSGTVDRPVVRGSAAIRDGGFYIRPIALAVDTIRGEVRLEDGTLATRGITARAGGGTIALRGRVQVFEPPRRLALTLHVDSVNVIETDSADVTLSADLRLADSLALPRVEGRIYDIHGWIREDMLRPMGPLDPADPPYAELAREVPWPEDSRLRRAAPEPPPPVRADVVVEVTPELSVIDEDSELFGTGRLRVRADTAGLSVRGLVRIEGGFYAFFGERFRVRGGAVRFVEDGFNPFVALIAEHEDGRALGEGRIETATAPDRFPPIELFILGPAATAREEIRRWSLLPESQEELAEVLIYGEEPQPVRGWRYPRFWRVSPPDELVNERAESRAVPLGWSYIADEAYEFIPLERGWLWAGSVEVGSHYPARLVVGPFIAAGTRIGRLELLVSQPLDGGVAPGLRARWMAFGGAAQAFSIPRFYADTPLGEGHPGFLVRRKTGVGVLWQWEW